MEGYPQGLLRMGCPGKILKAAAELNLAPQAMAMATAMAPQPKGHGGERQPMQTSEFTTNLPSFPLVTMTTSPSLSRLVPA